MGSARLLSLVSCLLMWPVLLLGQSATNANHFGLPAPRDPQLPGSLMLHGGGRITNDTFEKFWQLAGGRNGRIVLVPSAGFRPTDYRTQSEFLSAVGSRYSSWVNLGSQGYVKSFQFLYTDNPDDANDTKFCKALESATGVWFSGGAQSRLNYRYVGNYPQQTLFQRRLAEVVERGGIVGGTSAGMAALPEIMTMYETRDDYTAPANAIAAHGLGLLKGAIVEQHFDGRGGRLERFTKLLRNHQYLNELAQRRGVGEHMLGIAVEEKAAAIIQPNRIEVIGDGDVHLFIQNDQGRSVNWNTLSPGDSAQIRKEVPGTVMRREEFQLQR
jgi:cyanophycinase